MSRRSASAGRSGSAAAWPRTQMNTNSRMPTLPQNQNSGIRIVCSTGISSDTANMAAMPRKTQARDGQREFVHAARGIQAVIERDQSAERENDDRARSSNTAPGTAAASRPGTAASPRSMTVTMLAYSAMKNAANFMLLYSVWKPATSSFSASGKIERHAIGFRESRRS